MLEEIRSSYIHEANIAEPNWQKMDVNKLCNLYIENEDDEVLRSSYYACIVLKKWGYIGKYYLSSRCSGFTIDDCYYMVTEAISYILKARSWTKKDSKLYNDPQGPDKCLNRGIYSTRQRYYFLANRDKRKCNFGGKWSLETMNEKVGDHTTYLASDNFSEGTKSDIVFDTDLKLIINNLFKHNRFLEGLIIDNICFDDCFTQSSSSGSKFKVNKLINNLSSYDVNKLREICLKYSVNTNTLDDMQPVLTNKYQLAKIVNQTIKKMSKDTILKEALCY